MGTVANVRVNVQVPFPALVSGASGITITKTNGVWQIGLSAGQLTSIMAASGFVPSFTGTSLLDFGAFPGVTDAILVVTGQTGILSGSQVEAWLMAAATADHSIEEHQVDGPVVMAGNVVAGTGFTIYGSARDPRDWAYGKWNVGWRWQ
jgi:hypothetical protein